MTHSRRPGSSSITPLSERLKTPVRRREKTYISLVYIADGFADDCDEFIHCCTKEDEKLTYPVFAQYWHEMNFSSLYEGRSCGAEIAELSEEVIRIAKHYMLADTSNFEENVCGLFLVYALLNLQPYTNLACLRIVPEDMNAINHIEAVARRDKRLDVLYILGSVLVKGPVQYHADNRERGMDGAIKKYLEDGCMTIDNLGVRPKGVFYRQNPVLDTLRDMKNAYRKYDAIKSLIKTIGADINYVKIKDAEDLEASHKQLINGIREPAAVPTAVVPEERYQSVREIKAKAMKNTVNSIKHRTGVQERSKNEPASPQKPDIRSKPGKVKSGSPKKPLTTNSPRKPKMQQKYSPKAKKQKKQKNVRKRKYYSSSDSDSDVTIKLDDGDLTDDDGNDLDLDEYIERLQRKEKAQKDEVSEEKVNKEELVTQELDTQKVDTQELNMEELNMQLDTLPIYIRSAGDEDIEIEIIDEHVNSSSGENRTKRKKKVAQAKVMSLPDISFQNIDDTVPTENISEQIGLSSAPLANVSKITKNDDAVFKKPSSVINPKLKA
ncbi:uncharacterized protein LOC113239756, partial [Hyposmocoma kahamanoa]|uniref:uncharacterized protein LOC113239756 n=1 Tax=Hyposmocoma kahamanoa TaxID=1477025 RepID=UPI000E6D8150